MNFNQAIFKRGQLIPTLFKIMTYASIGTIKDIPDNFEYRIKRLLDLDAGEGGEAFYEQPPKGKGHDTLFSMFDAFCIGIGLYLSDMTIHQKHIIFLIKHIRNDLKKEFKWIMKEPPLLDRKDHQHIISSPRPYFEDENGQKLIDFTSYLTFRQISFKELYPALEGKLDEKNPLFANVKYYRGANHIQTLFNSKFPNHHKNIVIIETGHIAGGVYKYLPEAPELKRGR